MRSMASTLQDCLRLLRCYANGRNKIGKRERKTKLHKAKSAKIAKNEKCKNLAAKIPKIAKQLKMQKPSC